MIGVLRGTVQPPFLPVRVLRFLFDYNNAFPHAFDVRIWRYLLGTRCFGICLYVQASPFDPLQHFRGRSILLPSFNALYFFRPFR